MTDEAAHRRNGVRSVTVEGTVFEQDVIIRPDGQVKKWKNNLSKAVYGTSHTTLEKAKCVCGQRPDADRLIVGVESAW